jgi:hypothetical protein
MTRPDPDRVAVLAHGTFPDRAKTAVGILLRKADQVGQHKIVPAVDRFGRFVRDEIRVHLTAECGVSERGRDEIVCSVNCVLDEERFERWSGSEISLICKYLCCYLRSLVREK